MNKGTLRLRMFAGPNGSGHQHKQQLSFYSSKNNIHKNKKALGYTQGASCALLSE